MRLILSLICVALGLTLTAQHRAVLTNWDKEIDFAYTTVDGHEALANLTASVVRAPKGNIHIKYDGKDAEIVIFIDSTLKDFDGTNRVVLKNVKIVYDEDCGTVVVTNAALEVYFMIMNVSGKYKTLVFDNVKPFRKLAGSKSRLRR